MSTVNELMAAGAAAGLAVQLGTNKPAATPLTAAGSTKAGALALVSTVNIFNTVGSGAGASLPAAAGAAPVLIVNNGTNALLVYTGNGTDVINAGSTGTFFSVTADKQAAFWPAANTWVAVLSA